MSRSWRASPNLHQTGRVELNGYLMLALNTGFAELTKCNGMHDAAGQEGERSGDEQATDIGADHGAAMGPDVVRPGAIKGGRHPEECNRHKNVDGTEAEEWTVRHHLVDEERGDRRDGHQRKIKI